MLTSQEARALTQKLVEDALKKGASDAEVGYSGDADTNISVRLGVLEDAQRSESEGVSLTVFDGQRSASVSSASLAPHVLAELVERAVAMARATPEDPYAGLAPAHMLLQGVSPELDLDDGGAADPAKLQALALICEDAARAVPGITNSEGGQASVSRRIFALSTSGGFSAVRTGSSYSAAAAVIAGEGENMESDYASHTARHFADLEDAASIGARAGERAASRVGGKSVKGGKWPILFDPRAGRSMLGHLLSAISGNAIARRTSFLLGKDLAKIFPDTIQIWDDPHRIRGLASRPFDGEGLPTQRRALVENGMLTGWLCDSASARQLGIMPTGHAAYGGGVTSSNVHMENGLESVVDMISDVQEGVWITSLIGQGINPVTGDYSRGASGRMIRGGELAEPVNEITIAGNLITMFSEMRIANDLTFETSHNVPTIRIDGMTVAGG